MGRLTKEERKRLRREAEQSLRLKEFSSHVISPKATLSESSPKAIVHDASLVGVALEHRQVDTFSHSFGVPNANPDFAVVVGYTELTNEIVVESESYEWLLEDGQTLQLGDPTISFRAKVNLDPVVDFLHQTMPRVLGRLTHGILISGWSRKWAATGYRGHLTTMSPTCSISIGSMTTHNPTTTRCSIAFPNCVSPVPRRPDDALTLKHWPPPLRLGGLDAR